MRTQRFHLRCQRLHLLRGLSVPEVVQYQARRALLREL